MTLIPRLSDLPVGESVIKLKYGATGCGKTWETATCGNRTLHMDCENRRSTIQSKLIQDKFKYNPIYHAVHEDPLPDAGAKALDHLTRLLYDSYDYRDQFDVVVVDGVTALRRFGVNKGLEINMATEKSKTLMKMGDMNFKDVQGQKRIVTNELGFVNMEMNDFTAEMQLTFKFLFRLVEYCKEEKKHCLVTAHRRVDFEPKKKPNDPDVIKNVAPGFTGRTFPDEVIGIFDLIWYGETVGTGPNTQYRDLTVGGTSLIAKTAWPGLFPEYVINPNFQDIIRAIKEGKPLSNK